jgi:uncharacterized membrane protein
VFAVWMILLESKPWPMLTLVVSLEAIFLSTFVMIGQNRQASFQQAKADHDFGEQALELKTNTEITRQIYLLTGNCTDASSRSPTRSPPAVYRRVGALRSGSQHRRLSVGNPGAIG